MRDALVSPLLGAALRGAIVLLAAFVLTTLLHRRSAATRHAIWAGAVAAQLLLLGLDYRNLFAARPENVFLVKAAYWVGR